MYRHVCGQNTHTHNTYDQINKQIKNLNVAQLVSNLPQMHEAPGLIPTLWYMPEIPAFQESGVQGYPQLHSKFKASLSHKKLGLVWGMTKALGLILSL